MEDEMEETKTAGTSVHGNRNSSGETNTDNMDTTYDPGDSTRRKLTTAERIEAVISKAPVLFFKCTFIVSSYRFIAIYDAFQKFENKRLLFAVERK